MTLREALRQGIERLEKYQVPDPRQSAEALMAHCLSVDRTFLYTHDDKPLSDDELGAYESAIRRRQSRIPVQYIVGRQEFYGRGFTVNPFVLIPRPETEAIVESVLALNPPAESRILDVGTGSGCIGVTLALELPQARVYATDISPEAIRVAARNASELGARVHLVCMDVMDALGGAGSQFDFIVSNPPYISMSHKATLPPDVVDNEPHVALFASEDGLSMIRKIIPDAERLLKPGGHLALEIGMGMEERVAGLFGGFWEAVRIEPDLQGIPRTVLAQLVKR